MDKESILKLMKHLFNIVLRDIVREDMTQFLMLEISKVFKKSCFNNLLADTFLLMA